MKKRIGVIGARGYTGSELLGLIGAHPLLELDFVSSRELAGQPVPGFDCVYLDHDPQALSDRDVDVVVLAVPNGKTAPYIEAFEHKSPQTVLVDLSADRRFDSAWFYGLPELTRQRAQGKTRISNPGCYATAMQLVLSPLLHQGLVDREFPPQCFGISGYSGAGTTPSDRNNPALLADNIMPYASTGHMHEREVSHQMGTSIEFMPNVAGYFRGICMTVNLHLRTETRAEALLELYRQTYANEPLIQIDTDAPWVSSIAHKHGVRIGGVTVSADGRRAVVVSVLDNLLKGAATQAMQNINLVLGYPELMSVPNGAYF